MRRPRRRETSNSKLAIAADPDDATRWQVYADWLLERPNRIDDCLVVALGAPVSTLAVQLENELERWWATDLAAVLGVTTSRAMAVNARPQRRAQLRDGDLLELVPKLLVRFHLPTL